MTANDAKMRSRRAVTRRNFYDILGRKIEEIYSGIPENLQLNIPLDFSAGEYTSGVYFVELEQDNRSTIEKMILLK